MAKKKSKSVKKVSKKTKKTVAKKAKTKAPASSGPITPLGDRVLLRPMSEDESNKRTLSGIIIPDTVSKEKPEQGTVMAVGPGRIGDDNERVAISVNVGDRVVFSKYGFDEVKVDGVEYYLVSETNILAVINN